MAHGQYQVAVLISQIHTGVKGHFPRGTVSKGVAEDDSRGEERLLHVCYISSYSPE